MRDEIAIILNEDEDGQISVQLHGGIEKARKSFENMAGRPQDNPSRVSLVSIDFKNNKSVVSCKDLPVHNAPKDEQPDGIVLGEGPMWLDKENGNGQSIS